MKMTAAALAAGLVLVGAARAGVPGAAEKAKILELRAGVSESKKKIKRLALEQHKELALILERENSDLKMVKASAARGEALHAAILEVHEKSRRERLALRERRRSERVRLNEGLKKTRAEIVVFHRKK